MNLLLDTHIALWAVQDDSSLSARARALIEGADNAAYVSVVSLWEISIKHALQRRGVYAIGLSAREARAEFEAAGFNCLAVAPHHAEAVDDMPALHGDPFDRLLVAQALSEPLRLVTHDAKLAAYSDSIILV
jgi:PIN domain nuclease of toxin-antitoxin system